MTIVHCVILINDLDRFDVRVELLKNPRQHEPDKNEKGEKTTNHVLHFTDQSVTRSDCENDHYHEGDKKGDDSGILEPKPGIQVSDSDDLTKCRQHHNCSANKHQYQDDQCDGGLARIVLVSVVCITKHDQFPVSG